jgi:asparagine synthase (glutamine-hydrolysing)
MCGIVGFRGDPTGELPGKGLLHLMLAAIAHRGPDDQGFYLGKNVGLAHARLSIIDIQSGKQPMGNEDGTVFVSFNGEIFNYVELRKELIARGHQFRTNSDTEVIVHLYEEKGPDCVQHFNGDFAFALWDARRNLLMLARDRMGVRPLYYAKRRDCLFFASEIKALLQAPEVHPRLDPIALDQIFTFWFPLASRTAFQDIFELPPAHVLIASAGNIQVRRYWKLDYPQRDDGGDLDRRSQQSIAEELKHLLFDATRIRLRSDVPVGAYLSGGLDSSIVTAIVHKLVPDQLRTFSVTFGSSEFDESDFQHQVVDALQTKHSAVACHAAEIALQFPAVIRHTECPILRTAPTPLYLLSNFVHRNGLKVVLTGEGADEVFAGYDIFKEAKIRRFCAQSPQSPRRSQLFRRLYHYLPRLQAQSQKYLEGFFANGTDETADPLYSHLPRIRTTAKTKLFFSDDLMDAIRGYDALADLRDGLPKDYSCWHPLSQAQYLEAAYLLPSYILSSQGDRVAMAHAVEGRFPFLDHRVVEFAARIPPKLKLRTLREKHILRESMQNLLPPAVGNRPKQPYRAFESESFARTNASADVGACLSSAELRRSGYFDAQAVERLWSKCRRQTSIGARDNMALVGVISTQLWHRQFVQRSAAADVATADLVI